MNLLNTHTSVTPNIHKTWIRTSPIPKKSSLYTKFRSNPNNLRHNDVEQEPNQPLPELPSSCRRSSCICRRRGFIATVGTALLPVHTSKASISLPNGDDPLTVHAVFDAIFIMGIRKQSPCALIKHRGKTAPCGTVDVLSRVHPPRPDWYEEFYASAMDKSMKIYETEIAGYKSQLFAKLRGKAEKILEIGVGTGPNLKYYGDDSGVNVFGVDPNRKMEKYAKVAAEAAGLAPPNFKFIQAVAEALPFGDASMDAVVGTLVLCSVKDVDKTLKEVRRVLKPGGLYIFVEHVAAKDGSLLRFIQGILDPLQQTVADGCHLTRETGNNISSAGFSSVDINTAFLSSASLINPHAYGIAFK